MHISNTLHILSDQDGVLSDWGEGWDFHLDLEEYVRHTKRFPRHADQRSFDLRHGLTERESEVVDAIFNHPGFYATLKPIEGAVEGYRKMVEAGHHVQIATSPWWTNATCLQDKADWVEKHLGAEARSRMILTSDKTVLRADYLIDDKPNIRGKYDPDWEQIVFTQPYNGEVESRLRLDGWSDIETVLEQAMVKPGLSELSYV